MNLQERIDAEQRLDILRILAGLNDYQLSVSLLQLAMEDMEHRISSDRVLTLACWLEEQGLASIVTSTSGVRHVRVSDRGLELAHGRVHHPGVKRLLPSEL